MMEGWEDGRMGGWEDGRMGGWEDVIKCVGGVCVSQRVRCATNL